MSFPSDYPAPGLFIDGVWSEGTKSEPIYEPATGAVIGNVPHATAADLDRAAEAAARAFPVWSGKGAPERADILLKARALILERAKAIARILTREEGKALPEAMGDSATTSPTSNQPAEVLPGGQPRWLMAICLAHLRRRKFEVASRLGVEQITERSA